MGFIENAILMTMMILTINGMLYLAGLTQSADSSQLFSALPEGFQDYNKLNLNNSAIVSGQFGSQNDSLISSDATIGAQSTPQLQQSIPFFNKAFSLLSNLIFGMGFALAAAGLPDYIIWLVGIPTSIIATIGLLYMVLTGLSAIAGVFR